MPILVRASHHKQLFVCFGKNLLRSGCALGIDEHGLLDSLSSSWHPFEKTLVMMVTGARWCNSRDHSNPVLNDSEGLRRAKECSYRPLYTEHVAQLHIEVNKRFCLF